MIYTPEGFKVFGHFSKIEDCNGVSHIVRSVLEIMTNRTALDSLPDAIFVMMNPGSCEIDETSPLDEFPPTCNCVARPDNTQKRIIDLMTLQNWNHVRILNLSDLRNANSQQFFALLKRFDEASHSVFDNSRSKELEKALRAKPGAPVVKAWGVGKELDPLAELALKKLPKNAIGIGHTKNQVGYYHPLQRTQSRQQWWMDQILTQLS